MDWIGLLEIGLIVMVALISAYLLAWKFGAPPFEGRFQGIDGLRGFLSLFVFINHSAIWHSYAKNGVWRNEMSGVFSHLGRDSVWEFFMITGFLFFSKLLDARGRNLDWIRLYVSRILRLYPLYLLAMALFFLTMAVLVSFNSGGAWILILEDVLQWLGFSIFGSPRLCGNYETNALVGVAWTLVYEWLFYFSLPLQALCLRIVAPPFFIALGVASLFLWSSVTGPCQLNMAAFGCGMISAILVKSPVIKRLAANRLATLAIFVCIAITINIKSVEDPGFLVLTPLFMIFILVAGGNSIFGLLLTPAARTLGGMSYSIYLLHLFFLHTLFRFGLGLHKSARLSVSMHWMMIDAITPFLVFFCFTTWRWIEKPPMRHTAAFTGWVRAKLTLRGVY